MISSFLWRLVRTAASIGIATAVAWATNDPKWLWLAPVISAAAKVLREKFNLQNLPL